MRTREMSYRDYGMNEREVRFVKDFCRNADEEEKLIIKYALSEIQPYIAPYIFYSLTENMSYEKICAMNFIYMSKNDFYSYQRKGVASIKRWLQLSNKWIT